MLGKKARRLRTEMRLHNLKNNGRNFDSPGVVHKLERQLRNMKKEGEN